MKQKFLAFRIEWLWMEIHQLKRRQRRPITMEKQQKLVRKIAQKRFEAEQLRCLYEVLAGIRGLDGQIV